jgi:hypothetical protein
MAPEQFQKETYNNKVDVYAFGIMMWEMIARDIPYRGLSAEEIMVGVCLRQLRPVLPENTPDELANLVKRCWAFLPSHRPSFHEIYESFKAKGVMFEGTDPNAVDAFIAQLEEQTTENEQKEEEDETDSCYRFRLIEQVKSSSDCENLFVMMENGIRKHPESVFVGLRLLVRDHPERIPMLHESTLWTKLPWGKTAVFIDSYSLMYDIVMKFPAFLTLRELNMFFQRVAEHSHELMTLIALSKSEEIVNFMFENSTAFMHGKCSKLLFSFVHDLITGECPHAKCIPDFLSAAFASGHKSVITQAYRFLAQHFHEQHVPPKFTKHLKNPKTARSAALILAKWQSIPINKRLITALCESATEAKCFGLLLRCAALPEWASLIASRAARWKSACEDSIRLVYVLLSHGQLKVNEECALQFRTFLQQALDIDKPLFSAITLILSKMARNQSVVAQYEQAGLFRKFFRKAITMDTTESIRAGTALVEAIAKVSLCPSLQIMISSGRLIEERNMYGNSVVQHLSCWNEGRQPTDCARVA